MLPLHMVQADLTSGALVEIHAEDDPREGAAIGMSAAYLTNKPPGRAGRWFIDRLKEEAAAPRVNGAPAVSANSISPILRANRNPVLLQATVGSSPGRAALTRLKSTGG
jgi:hypothetical protein